MVHLFRPLVRTILVLALLSGGFGPVHRVWAAPAAMSPELPCPETVRIMPLGDSITRGSSSGTPEDPQYYISYRRDLYTGLTASGYSIDFVGSRRSDGTAYPDFDRDHEGWPGKRDEYIAQYIYSWLKKNPADIILLHIGTNDMSSAIPDTGSEDVEKILKEIDRFNPRIWVLVARIIQRTPYNQNTATFNKNVDAMLDARIKAGDKIVKVDMENGAGIVYSLYPAGDLYDEKHPYATGYAKMAVKWEQALTPLLGICGCDQTTASGENTGLDAVDPSQSTVVCRPRVFFPLVGFRSDP